MRGGFAKRWLGATALSALACGEPEEIAVKDGEQTEAFCDANCTRASECGSGGSLCQSYCEAELGWLDRYRPEAMQLIVRCIVDIPCASFFDEGSFTPCWERAARKIEPTKSLRRFCQSWSRRWFECGSSYPIEECERDWALYKASFLERVLECTEGTCDALPACTDAAVIPP